MSTLSQFFGGSIGGKVGTFQVFLSSGTVTVPSSASYIAYGVVGGGAGAQCCAFSNPISPTCTISQCSSAGGGGGFSWWNGSFSCASPVPICVTVGAGGSGGSSGPTGFGGSSCVSGPTAICATGAGIATNVGINYTNCSWVGGNGFGGKINTCGGNGGFAFVPAAACGLTFGGAGAGGLIGNGGCGGAGYYTMNTSNTLAAGGGGFGSGGGGGAALTAPSLCAASTSQCAGGGGACVGMPGSTFFGSPAAPSGINYSAFGGSGLNGTGGTTTAPAAPGFSLQYTDNGCLSQAKTFFSASGGGGGVAMTSLVQAMSISSSSAGAGGGGAGAGAYNYCQGSSPVATDGGFGGGGGASFGTNYVAGNVPLGGLLTVASGKGGIGGGGGMTSFACCGLYSYANGGQGIAIVEYW